MQHRTSAALAASALVLGGLAAVTVPTPAGAAGGWHSFGGAGFGAIPDGLACGPTPGAPRDVTFDVSGMPAGQLADVEVADLAVTHPFTGDVSVTLIAPGGIRQATVFARTSATTVAGLGESSDLAGPYRFTDRATPTSGGWWQAALAVGATEAIPAGDYFATTTGGAATGPGTAASLTGAFGTLGDANGLWTLRFTDGCNLDTGSVSAATLRLRVSTETCTTEQGELAFQQAAVAAATTAVGAAQQAVSTAATGLTAQDAAVVAAQKAVKKAKKAKKAKRKKAVARAKAQLAKAVLAQAQARGSKTTADARVDAATAALTSAQANAARAQSALTACQQE